MTLGIRIECHYAECRYAECRGAVFAGKCCKNVIYENENLKKSVLEYVTAWTNFRAPRKVSSCKRNRHSSPAMASNCIDTYDGFSASSDSGLSHRFLKLGIDFNAATDFCQNYGGSLAYGRNAMESNAISYYSSINYGIFAIRVKCLFH
jgi:hypothetical protein